MTLREAVVLECLRSCAGRMARATQETSANQWQGAGDMVGVAQWVAGWMSIYDCAVELLGLDGVSSGDLYRPRETVVRAADKAGDGPKE